jgi:hypothetical protein
MIKLRMTTGTYQLQTNRRAFNQTPVDTTCLLCKQEPETRKHLIAVCPGLRAIREKFNDECPLEPPMDQDLYTQMVLDPSAAEVKDILGETPIEDLDLWTRRLCYTIHAERTKIIAKLPTRKRYGL